MEHYPRKIEEKIEKWLDIKEILLVKGLRWAGKTTLFLHLQEILGGKYVTMEDEEFKDSFEGEPKEFGMKRVNGTDVIIVPHFFI